MASSNRTIRQLSARNAALIRHGGDNSATAAELAAERLADYVRRVVDKAPPLTAEQRDRIASLLWSGRRSA